ncbi:alpha-2-macroglobulin family protein [Pseudoalteromonas sp. McH1-42]|uniref:alpha-2-macroglobulin family protein n=1 Tax=Pseudoalteromonas sp. McH1-42 TaxID=2917752 RepID=UPI001EF6EEED|nr:alpha-2-macroglobulin family protein [Pseudoalteromonas sp. McH1-42]MCG7561379.1 hypothetical protein [Pseudoalteromonas sp. McH1-42]
MLQRSTLLLLTFAICLFQAQALEVENVRFNTHKNKLTQILIQFNEEVAQPGQVPSHAQLSRIWLSDKYKQLCRWRFVSLNKLSCDLYAGISAYVPLEVRIEANFPGLHAQLQEDYTTQWHSANWPLYIDEYQEKQLQLRYRATTDTDKRAVWDITHSLTFTLHGQPVTPSKRHYGEYSDNRGYLLTFDFADSLQPGGLEVTLPAGFRPTEAHIALPAPQTIPFQDQISQPPAEAKFMGVFCEQSYPFDSFWYKTYHALSLDDIATCAPESLAFGFNHKVDKFWLMESVISPSISTQPVIITGSARENPGDDLHYYPVALKGDTDYQLNFSALRSDSTKQAFSGAATLHFSTAPNSPYWQISDQSGDAYQADTHAELPLMTRNTQDLSIQFYPAKTLTQLHHWLTTKDKTTLLTKVPDVSRHMDNQLHQSRLPVSARLNDQSGVLFYDLRGASTASIYASDVEMRQHQHTLIASDFNLTVHQGPGITLRSSEFNTDVPMTDVEVYLACPSFVTPKQLGKSESNGLLTLSYGTWQSLLPHSDLDCWLWASKGEAHAITKITPKPAKAITGSLLNSQPIYQPGSAIDLSVVLYQHTQNGLQPLLDNVDLILRDRDTDHTVQLEQRSISEFGIRQFHLTKGLDKASIYQVSAEVAGEAYSLGDLLVFEFIPPEVELSWQHPDMAYKDQPMTISVSGKTMNGYTADNLSGELKYQFIRFGYSDLPSDWPQDYEFSSSREAPDNRHQRTVALSAGGPGASAHFTPTETMPLVRLALSGRVVTEQGEMHFFDQALTYLSRAHYIGLKESDDKVHIIAVDQGGAQLSVPAAVYVEVSTSESGKERTEQVLLCEVHTPAYCDLPDDQSGYYSLDIRSGKQNYLWQRYLFRHGPSNDEHTSAHQLTLFGDKQVLAGQEYAFSLDAPQDGEALVFVTAGENHALHTFAVKRGSNDLTLAIPNSWRPGFEITAVMPYTDKQRAVLRQQWQNKANQVLSEWQTQPRFTLASSAPAMPDKPGIHGQFARLTVAVLPAQSLSLEVTHPDAVPASGQLDITLSSNQDADIQLWLVNDALFNIAYDEVTDIHLAELFNQSRYHHRIVNNYNLNNWLVDPQLTQQLEQTSLRAKYEALRMTGSSMADNNSQAYALAQSVWQPVISLNANQEKTVTLALPQLLGRWRVFAVALNAQDTQTYTGTLTSHAQLEYHVTHATHFIQGDEAIITVRAANRTNTAQKDTMQLTLNGQTLIGQSIVLNSQGEQVMHVPLPKLDPGEYTLKLYSRRLNKPRFSTFKVSDNSRIVQASWLLDPARQNTIALADDATLVSGEAHPIKQLAPNWSALTQHHQHYPHQCWEQTLSRALSYSVNPLASQLWPDGKASLQHALTKGETENLSWHHNIGYAYYPNRNADPMLSAYTLLVSHWLSGSDFDLNTDQETLESMAANLLKALQRAPHNRRHFIDDSADWQWWALAQKGQVTLEQILSWRQMFGVSGTRSNLLQLLAMKAAGYNQPELEKALARLLDEGFQDQTLSALSGPQEQCLALMLTERKTLTAQLSKLAISRQHRQGHFGNTLTDGICSLALKGHRQSGSVPVTITQHNSAQDNEQSYHIDSPLKEAYWLTVQSRQPLASPTVVNSGLDVTRRYQVYDNNRWQPFAGQALKPGNLIKVSLEVFSAEDRAHVLLTDTLAGGLHALNPEHRYTQYKNWLQTDYADITLHLQQTKQGAQQATFYQAHLSAGTTTFEYLAQVRASGLYLAPPARAEMMYQPDIAGNSNAETISIATLP